MNLKKEDPDTYYFYRYVAWLEREIRNQGHRWKEKKRHLRWLLNARQKGRV